MPDFSLGKWRVLVRESGQVVREETGHALELAYPSFERIAGEHVLNRVTNIELQFRPPGARRFKAIEQAIGPERITWAPADVRELLGQQSAATVAVTSDGCSAYLSREGSNTITRVNSHSGTVTSSTIGSHPKELTVDGQFVLVRNPEVSDLGGKS